VEERRPEVPARRRVRRIAELERDFGVEVTDLHRPFIDTLTRPNPDDPTGKSTMRRVPDVLDCWFESGSMPFAQIHYPFENKEWFEKHFPADFIVEYVAQTRGWFYTLVVLGTALFDKPPFRNVICHGVVLDENGQKLSKRLRNYPDPEEVFETIGSDALRWFLMSSPVLRGGDLQIDKDGRSIREVVRLVLNPVWNAYAFFTLYANADGYRAAERTDSQHVLDRYVLGKTRALVLGVQKKLDDYDLAGACADVVRYFDALNNWYIRRSRPRFWSEAAVGAGGGSGGGGDKKDAFDTLYTVLVTLSRALAPLLPLVTEEIHTGLTGADSVHLQDWPDVSSWPEERELVAAMDRVRDVCSAGLALRKANDLRGRLPLRRLVVAGAGIDGVRGFADLVRDELNVKDVVFHDGGIERFATFQLAINARVVGPKLGADMKTVMGASRSGQWRMLEPDAEGRPRVEVGGRELVGDEFDLRLQSKEGVASQALPGNEAIVVLDTEVTPELEAEGLVRDLVRLVQQARKDAGLHVSDRIALGLSLPAEVRAAVEGHLDYLGEQVLATSIDCDGGVVDHVFVAEKPLGDGHAEIRIAKV
jgi:isoleucyl-tRNA synthetase